MIRQAFPADLDQISSLHMECFPNRFLSKLDVKLLKEYYRGFLNEDNIFLVNLDEKTQRVNGFILGTCSAVLVTRRFLRQNFIGIALRIMALSLTLDTVILVSMWNHITSRAKKRSVHYELTSNSLSLHAICVSGQFRGRGVAKRLVEEFENTLIAKGYEAYTLSVRKQNKTAILFYEKRSMMLIDENAERLLYTKKVNLNQTKHGTQWAAYFVNHPK